MVEDLRGVCIEWTTCLNDRSLFRHNTDTDSILLDSPLLLAYHGELESPEKTLDIEAWNLANTQRLLNPGTSPCQ